MIGSKAIWAENLPDFCGWKRCEENGSSQRFLSPRLFELHCNAPVMQKVF
jgi:hypothetical protein